MPGIHGLLTLAVSVVVLAALYVGREVFLPIVLAILLAFVLAPFVDLLRRWHLGRVPSVIIAVLVALGHHACRSAASSAYQLAGLATDLPRYQTTIKAEDRLRCARARSAACPEIIRSRRHAQFEQAAKEPTAAAGRAAPHAGPPEPRRCPSRSTSPTPTPAGDRAAASLLPLLKPLATIGIVFVVLIFILLQREDLRDRMIRLFGSSDLHRTTAAMDDAARRLSRYFLLQLGLNATFGVVIAIGLWAHRRAEPAPLGHLRGAHALRALYRLLHRGALPIALAAAVDPGWSMALMTLALFLISEPLMGHVIEPLVYGQSTGLSPFAVVISAIFWTWLWGPIGLLIATPLTLCLVVLGRHVERLEFLDVLLGDRPALTPGREPLPAHAGGRPRRGARIGRAAAARTARSRPTTTRSPCGALQLAANDASRGVLTAASSSSGSRTSSMPWSHDLDSPRRRRARQPRDTETSRSRRPGQREARDRGAGRAARRTACRPDSRRAGRRAAPSCALRAAVRSTRRPPTMLAQLLQKHGLGAAGRRRTRPSRAPAIAALDTTGVQMVCMSYLEIAGTPAHLRYLLRRMRKRLPGVPILVGLWPAEEAILKDEALRASVGADVYVTTLREAVLGCLEVATRPAKVLDAAGMPVRPEAPKVRMLQALPT